PRGETLRDNHGEPEAFHAEQPVHVEPGQGVGRAPQSESCGERPVARAARLSPSLRPRAGRNRSEAGAGIPAQTRHAADDTMGAVRATAPGLKRNALCGLKTCTNASLRLLKPPAGSSTAARCFSVCAPDLASSAWADYWPPMPCSPTAPRARRTSPPAPNGSFSFS